MKREWRVVYRISAGALLSIDVVALTEAAARALVECTADITVVSVAELRALVDPNQQWLNLQEAAVRTGKSPRTIARWVETGLLTKCDGAFPMWTVRAIDLAAARSVGLKLDQEGELKAA